MNYQQAKIFLTTTIIIAIVLIVGMIIRPLLPKSAPDEEDLTEPRQAVTVVDEKQNQETVVIPISPKVGNLAKQFNDLNDVHLAYAQKIGIKPISDTRDIMRLTRPLVHIKSGEYYTVAELSYSYPYLVPEAAQLLDTIGARFNRILSQHAGAHYKLKITSLLRTQESVKRLKRGNVNSTSNSAHLYGTTFDISHSDFNEQMFNTAKISDGRLKNILAGILIDLREEGKCLVKFERKQACFHITATGK